MTIELRLLKIFLAVVFNLPGIRSRSTLPTFTKVYNCQPTLTNRVFIPESYKNGDALLPLYLHLHGSGFAFGGPWLDDPFCKNFANDNKVLVIGLDYPKTPSHPYPAAVHALTDVIEAILKDETLPYDKKKVAIGGFSAGGNLSLAITQNENLREKIGGVVSYYAPFDFVTTAPQKMLTRPDSAPPDLIGNISKVLDHAYVCEGQDLTDPMLSTRFAQRHRLPPKLCIVGCEFDLLCREAEIFAERMASSGSGERTGSDVLWEKNGVRWEKILGELHGKSV